MSIENNFPEKKYRIIDGIKNKANLLINYGSATGRNTIFSIGLIVFISVAGFEISEISLKKIKEALKKKS